MMSIGQSMRDRSLFLLLALLSIEPQLAQQNESDGYSEADNRVGDYVYVLRILLSLTPNSHANFAPISHFYEVLRKTQKELFSVHVTACLRLIASHGIVLPHEALMLSFKRVKKNMPQQGYERYAKVLPSFFAVLSRLPPQLEFV
jgi:hypothetical protein